MLKRIALIGIIAFAAGCACHAHKPGDNLGGDGQGPLTDVHYAFDSYKLDKSAKDVLAKDADWLKANPGHKVEVEGHCDERGTNEYNMVLGSNRAKAAKDYLLGLGIASNSLSSVSYGEELPLDPRHNEEAWAKNRRAHFNVK